MRHELWCCPAVRHGPRYCTARDELLKRVPYTVALVRAWLSRSLPGNALPCHTAYTLRAAGEPDVLPDGVVCAGDALFLAAAGVVVFPSCSRGWAAGVAVLVKTAADTAAAAAAAVAMRTTVVKSPRVAGAAAAVAVDASVDVLADDAPHHRRGARLTACPFYICRVTTSTGASFRFWLELLFRAIPSSTGTIRASRRFMLPSKVMPCFPIFEDNQGAVQLAQNPITNSNSKHIDVRHHFLRELVRQRDIKVVQVPSEFQHADILTKALAFDLFAFHRKFLMNLK